MRVRKPIPEQPTTVQLIPVNQWKTFNVTLITPLFGGGVTAGEPDINMPIRAAAIRGQLRYWWRFLNKDTPDLFNEERKIWGGAAEDEEDFASKVKLKIRQVTSPSISEYSGQAGYALFPARATDEAPVKHLIQKGLSFNLLISCEDEGYFKMHVEESLRWWATFGGLGARTRRGAGSVSINQLNPINQEEAREKSCQLEILRGHENTYGDAADAWEASIKILQSFRQGEFIARNSGDGKKLGRSLWPEPDSVRKVIELSDPRKKFTRHPPKHNALISFPRAAFGLPIITHFTGWNEPVDTELAPSNAERLASPLILTAYSLGDDKYSPAALLMPVEHINNLELKLSFTGSGDIETYSKDQWWDSSKKDKVAPIKKSQGDDALSAFMNFFQNGGKQS